MLDRQVLHLPHLDLSYLIGGNGSESLLLLHGMADCAVVWSSLADHLGSRYRIIAPDLRGHGESSKDITDYSFTSIIADLEALMQHLGVTKVHVLAHSWSAKTAAIWATQKSDRFSSLIFVDRFFVGRFISSHTIEMAMSIRIWSIDKIPEYPVWQSRTKSSRCVQFYRSWCELFCHL